MRDRYDHEALVSKYGEEVDMQESGGLGELFVLCILLLWARIPAIRKR